MTEIHINQLTSLAEKYSKHFQFDLQEFYDKLETISADKGKFLFALYFNRKINEMRLELIKLGVRLHKRIDSN